MENVNKSVLGGLGGAALVALLLMSPTSKPTGSTAGASAKPIASEETKAKAHSSPLIDDSGPWIAFCQDY
jgi:hypothetical protein